MAISLLKIARFTWFQVSKLRLKNKERLVFRRSLFFVYLVLKGRHQRQDNFNPDHQNDDDFHDC